SWVTITRACFAKPFSLGDRERRQRSFHDRNRRPATIHGTGTPSGTSKGHPITNAQTRTNPRTTAGKTTSKVTFAELGVPKKLTETLSREGKTAAFPIQQDTLPDTLAGRDVLGRGKTGSGKTLAFSIPLVARLAASPTGPAAVRRPRRLVLGTSGSGQTPAFSIPLVARLAAPPTGQAGVRRPRGLVLAPPRELATQITAVIDPLAHAAGLKTTTIFGGVKQKRQENALNAGVDIVVACPGRLEDLLQQELLSLDHIEVTILDEADHMADLGFLPGVTRILKQTPTNGQRMFFSATLDNDVDKLVRRFLHNEVLHSVD